MASHGGPSASTSSATLATQAVSHNSNTTHEAVNHGAEAASNGRNRGVSWDVEDEETTVDGVEGEDGEGDKGREVEIYTPGGSSFSQTVSNSLGDLVGQGILACPLAVAYCGWVLGPLLLLSLGALTLWTLKLLIRIIEKDRRLRSYTDVIGYGLGPTGFNLVSVLFTVEVTIWLLALVVVFADSCNAVFPSISVIQWKFLSLVFTIPVSFLPLRYISVGSVLGVLATSSLIAILVFSGVTTPHAPGSLREPAPTDIWPTHGFVKVGVAVGLFISGFGGHSLVPTLIHDMKRPRQADRMCEVAYAICAVIYILVAVVGYLMYGSDVSDQVSKDLVRTPGFSPVLNKFAVLATAVNALTKIPLGVRPLADMIFTHLNLHPTVLLPRGVATPHYTEPNSPASEEDEPLLQPEPEQPVQLLPQDSELFADDGTHHRRERLKMLGRFIIEFTLPILSVLAALVLPSFESLLSLLGSGFAVITTILLPVAAKAKIYGWKKYEVFLFTLSAALGIIGVVCTFIP